MQTRSRKRKAPEPEKVAEVAKVEEEKPEPEEPKRQTRSRKRKAAEIAPEPVVEEKKATPSPTAAVVPSEPAAKKAKLADNDEKKEDEEEKKPQIVLDPGLLCCVCLDWIFPCICCVSFPFLVLTELVKKLSEPKWVLADVVRASDTDNEYRFCYGYGYNSFNKPAVRLLVFSSFSSDVSSCRCLQFFLRTMELPTPPAPYFNSNENTEPWPTNLIKATVSPFFLEVASVLNTFSFDAYIHFPLFSSLRSGEDHPRRGVRFLPGRSAKHGEGSSLSYPCFAMFITSSSSLFPLSLFPSSFSPCCEAFFFSFVPGRNSFPSFIFPLRLTENWHFLLQQQRFMFWLFFCRWRAVSIHFLPLSNIYHRITWTSQSLRRMCIVATSTFTNWSCWPALVCAFCVCFLSRIVPRNNNK